MQVAKKKYWCKLLPVILGVFLLTGMFSLSVPNAAYAAGSEIIISGPGLNNTGPITITQNQLQGVEPLPSELQTVAGWVYLPQHDEIYSTINTWPTKSWYRGEGVKLMDLLNLAGGLNENATQIRFTSRDGFKATFTIQEIIDASRYRFPAFMDTGLPGHIPGDPLGAEQVETIIAYQSFSVQDYNDILNEDYFSHSDANHLLFGQRAVTQQTNARFAKYVKEIEVLTDPAPQWNNPTATVEPGEVEVGTRVELHSQYNDEDKIHYTLDGTVPTIESPMYNWIASRWWKDRSDELDQINHPIEIMDNTIVKAITIGPGKLDSDVVTLEYLVSLALIKDNPAPAIKNQEYSYTFTAVCGVEPYSFTITGGSLPEGMALNRAVLEGKPTNTGTYTFTITVTDKDENTDSHEFTLVVEEAPPTLTADTTDNTVGKPIELNFTDDQTWREAITDVKVNDTSIAGKYNVAAGKLTMDPEVFTTAGSYTIAVIAIGYADAIVTQQINSSGSGQQPDPDEDIVLTITGDGVANPQKYTKSQLEAMPQEQHVYSSVNTWPTKNWYVGKGVSLQHLLNEAEIRGNAQQIKFYSRDGYYTTLTVQELLYDKRYRFPNFMSGGQEGHIAGSSSGASAVETIIALNSASGTDNPAYMNDTNALLLMLGQRAVTEQTGPQFAKYVNRIEVLTTAPGKWEVPRADTASGTVTTGTQVKLSSTYNDQDKIHYTTDGSTPTLESPMYNWIASRWWSSRSDVLDAINCPIELTKDTTIKAITIGPGKQSSDVVEFTYRVTGTAATTSGPIKPDEGGRVSIGDEAVIEIPAGALKENDVVEVKIERVSEPPAVPAGFRILGSVYEFSVGDKTSYGFNKAVAMKFRFNPDEVGPGEIPAVYCYDKAEEKWINLGGEISGNTITVQVDHFTKFAVIVVNKSIVVETVEPDKGGKVILGEHASVEIPADALPGSSPVEVKIERVSEPPSAPVGFRIVSGVFEFKVDDKTNCSLNKAVTIKLKFDSRQVGSQETPVIHRFDQDEKKWINIGGEVSGNNVTVQVDCFTVFAVMVETKSQTLKDIAGHWAEKNINQLVALGAVGGYPDSTFKPENKITRAEFAAILVKAFKLESQKSKAFADTAGHWARDSISTATYHGIVSGYDATTFGPDDNITREQMAVMVMNASQLPAVTAGSSLIDSESISAWAKEAVATAVKNGIINGYPDNTFRPRANATRAEAVTVVVNALKL